MSQLQAIRPVLLHPEKLKDAILIRMTDNDLTQSIEKDLASVTVPNKPMSLLLQNLSSHQLEKVSRITALNYIEALLSWSAPIPPPVSILREMEIKEIMSPPSPVEIVYFYIMHELWDSRKRV